MKNTLSLKKNAEFRFVYEHGKSMANKQLVMYLLKKDQPLNHLGISVSKKIGNSVVRHRVKRLIKEIYRLSEENIDKGYDIVIVARNGFLECDFADMKKSFLHLAKKHGLVKRSDMSEKNNH